ncbi:hypothetical protein P171DRAFT_471692 [Karstenula rhodostoma CBS 690.94]|uniref:Uncharacterized protein n=1 Tax=Karstenula rhodostoma CBS 690.94 TaxID=1392251 RepID=A0A9P4PMK4_9PLEO|nr:hypothetical protein P171DRAFT_471692 [Karstenula rhodostoma CBS 690.94]
MSFIAKNLADLPAAVGAQNIAHLPALENLEVMPQNEDVDAFHYRILYGVGKVSTMPLELGNVWIYLVPYANRPHELYSRVFYGQYVGRIVKEHLGPSIAFGNVAIDRRIQALAKYYFLAMMHHRGYEDKELKAPFNICKTLVEDLKVICLDFARQPKAIKLRKEYMNIQEGPPVAGPDSERSCNTASIKTNKIEGPGRVANHMPNTQDDPLPSLGEPSSGLLNNIGEEELNIPNAVTNHMPNTEDDIANPRGAISRASGQHWRSITQHTERSRSEGQYLLPVVRLPRVLSGSRRKMTRSGALVQLERQSTTSPSPAPSLISVTASSITMAATPVVQRTREQDIVHFNWIHTRELALS